MSLGVVAKTFAVERVNKVLEVTRFAGSRRGLRRARLGAQPDRRHNNNGVVVGVIDDRLDPFHSCHIVMFRQGMASQVAEKLPDDVIPKPGVSCRAESLPLRQAQGKL